MWVNGSGCYSKIITNQDSLKAVSAEDDKAWLYPLDAGYTKKQ